MTAASTRDEPDRPDPGCRQVALVTDDRGEVVCAHTVGLPQCCGHPELVVFGLDAGQSEDLLDAAREEIGAGRRLLPGGRFEGLLQHYPVAVREVAPSHLALFDAAVRFHGGQGFAMVQLFWPDKQGRFPWDPGVHEAVRAGQPVLEKAPSRGRHH